MTLRSATKTLLVLALGLPVVQAVLTWVRGLLAAMGDEAGAAMLGRVMIVGQASWLILLVALLIVLAVLVVTERPMKE
jgi:hypothetical protein